MSVTEAMGLLGVSRATVIRYVKTGVLSGFQKTPGLKKSEWRIYAHSIERILAQREQQAQ